MSEKHVEDYWNVDGDRELSDAWTGGAAQVQCQVLGQTFVCFSSLQTLMNDGKYVFMVRSPFTTKLWVSTPKDQGCHHEVWLHLASVDHHGDNEPRERH